MQRELAWRRDPVQTRESENEEEPWLMAGAGGLNFRGEWHRLSILASGNQYEIGPPCCCPGVNVGFSHIGLLSGKVKTFLDAKQKQ